VISLEELRAELAAAGDPERAAQQQRYMKSEMPYHGLAAPELKRLLRPHLRAFTPPDRATWEETVRDWWDGATHREEWHIAIALARHRSARPWQDVRTLDLYRHLIVTGAWWDVVDETAQHLVGACLLADRERVTPVLRVWATDADLWVRRTSVICQIAHGEALDRNLLAHAIECNLDDSSFWLRKAIGWAVRQHARTDPVLVRSEVDRLGDRLSGLSRREALKHLG
jgi:3-methyladenine DNA glycosylase AlkD